MDSITEKVDEIIGKRENPIADIVAILEDMNQCVGTFSGNCTCRYHKAGVILFQDDLRLH